MSPPVFIADVVPLTLAVAAVDIDVVAVVVDSDVPSLHHCC